MLFVVTVVIWPYIDMNVVIYDTWISLIDLTYSLDLTVGVLGFSLVRSLSEYKEIIKLMEIKIKNLIKNM